MELIHKAMVEDVMRSAVQEGQLHQVKSITERYGLSYSGTWRDGYALLCNALRINQYHIAEFLIKAGAKLNERTESFGIPLHFAVLRKRTDIIHLLLEKGALVDCRFRSCTALYNAVQKQNMEITTLLLKYGADVNIPDYRGRTALHIAVKGQQVELVDLLLRHGADVNAVCTVFKDGERSKRTVLYIAVKDGCMDIVKCLLRYHPDITDTGNHHAVIIAMHKDTDILSDLHEYGFVVIPGDENNVLFDLICRGDVDKLEESFRIGGHFKELLLRSDQRCTPLHVATKFQMQEVVKLMISYGADVNAKDEDGKSSLAYAINAGDFSMFEILLTKEKNLGEALCTAVRTGDINFVKALLERGADVNVRDENFQGLPPLLVAVRKCPPDVVTMLLDYGADLNSLVYVKNRYDSYTPLLYSISCHNSEACEIFLRRDADINALTAKGDSALHLACNRAWPESLLCLLLKHGADVSVNSRHGTALHGAAVKGCEKNVELLLEYGSDINVNTREGYNALDTARTGRVHISNNSLFDGQCTNPEAFNCLLRHLVKTKAANLFVSDRNQEYLEPDVFQKYCSAAMGSNEKQISTGFASACAEEVKILKTEKIGCSNLTFHQILTTNRRQLVHITKNRSIEEILLSSDFENKFPIYATMIKSKFELGKRRRDLEDRSRVVLLTLCPFLPLVCIDNIQTYLTDKDLRLFINAWQPGRDKIIVF